MFSLNVKGRKKADGKKKLRKTLMIGEEWGGGKLRGNKIHVTLTKKGDYLEVRR